MTSIKSFISKHIDFTSSNNYKCKTIYCLYKFECRKNSSKPVSYREFRDKLEKENIVCKRIDGVYYVTGINLRILKKNDLLAATKLFYQSLWD